LDDVFTLYRDDICRNSMNIKLKNWITIEEWVQDTWLHIPAFLEMYEVICYIQEKSNEYGNPLSFGESSVLFSYLTWIESMHTVYGGKCNMQFRSYVELSNSFTEIVEWAGFTRSDEWERLVLCDNQNFQK
jgi:hypothetical protein